MRLVPKNWESFQHYKDRCPPWIKLHKALLDDSTFQRLPVASRALAPMLWLLASESKDGSFDGSIGELSFRLRQTEKEISAGIEPLIDKGFFSVAHDASDSLAERKQVAVPERETETEAYKEEAEIESAAAPKKTQSRATTIPSDFCPNDNGVSYAENKKLNLAIELESFRNFHTAKGSTWKDWQATWRTWCDKAVEFGRSGNQRASPGYKNIHDQRAETIAILTGRKTNEPTSNERDITSESFRVA